MCTGAEPAAACGAAEVMGGTGAFDAGIGLDAMAGGAGLAEGAAGLGAATGAFDSGLGLDAMSGGAGLGGLDASTLTQMGYTPDNILNSQLTPDTIGSLSNQPLNTLDQGQLSELTSKGSSQFGPGTQLASANTNMTPEMFANSTNVSPEMYSDFGPPSANSNAMNNMMGFQGGLDVAGSMPSPFGEYGLSATDSSLGAAGNANQMAYAPGYEAATPYLNNMGEVNALEGAGVSGANLPTGAGAYNPSFLDSLFSKGMGAIEKNPLSAAQLGMKGVSSLYDMYAKKQMANAQQQRYDQLNNQVNNMYAPGSPEYNLMEQTMARKDAAAGRNSQYGTRATDLAGKIAGIKAGYMSNIAGNQNTLLNNQLANRYGGLNSMFFNASR